MAKKVNSSKNSSNDGNLLLKRILIGLSIGFNLLFFGIIIAFQSGYFDYMLVNYGLNKFYDSEGCLVANSNYSGERDSMGRVVVDGKIICTKEEMREPAK